jgi:hypothetical protein
MRVPPFPEWIGRTALLSGEAGAARLLLAVDGTGALAVRAFFACHVLPVLSWHIGPSGDAINYRRQSALFPGRVIEGSATILPGAVALRWVEARDHLAALDGFAPPDAARSCG